MKTDDTILVCEECGGTNIQMRAWVDANTNEYKGDSGDYDKDSNWCDDCEEHVHFCRKSEYIKNKENENTSDMYSDDDFVKLYD